MLFEVNKITAYRTSKRLRSYSLRYGLFVTLLAGYMLLFGGRRTGATADPATGRQLLFEKDFNCTQPAIDDFPSDAFTRDERQNGALVLHFFLATYIFILMAVVCDDYFVPSIKVLCHRLGLSEDVAGATFMAAATSSPELFINIVGTFVTEGDIGVGAIVGSAVFNILAVPACCGLFGGQIIKIDWWPLTRDCVAYGATVLLLIYTLQDGVVAWYDALMLVTLYVFYLITMYFNDHVSRYVKRTCRRQKKYKLIPTEASPLLISPQILDNNNFDTNHTKLQVDSSPSSSSSIGDDSNTESHEGLGTIPEGFWNKCFFFFTWPISFCLYLTVPDCNKYPRIWPLTFLMCIVWIASTSYIVSWMITLIGDAFGVPDSVMGLTFLAAGMSVPEAASSVIVTNQGHGAMGISSSIGSNTFDILLCLGLPWLIKGTFFPAIPGQHFVIIMSEGLTYDAISLLTTLLLLYGSIALNNYVLDRKIGLLCLILYISFLVLASLMELNVFFQVNMPSCPS